MWMKISNCCWHRYACSTEETFLQDFLVILKPSIMNKRHYGHCHKNNTIFQGLTYNSSMQFSTLEFQNSSKTHFFIYNKSLVYHIHILVSKYTIFRSNEPMTIMMMLKYSSAHMYSLAKGLKSVLRIVTVLSPSSRSIV